MGNSCNEPRVDIQARNYNFFQTDILAKSYFFLDFGSILGTSTSVENLLRSHKNDKRMAWHQNLRILWPNSFLHFQNNYLILSPCPWIQACQCSVNNPIAIVQRSRRILQRDCEFHHIRQRIWKFWITCAYWQKIFELVEILPFSH